VRDNLRHRRDIERAYLDAIGAAREEIVLANAYFLPGRRFRRALRAAAGRGVRVTILLQGLVEYRLLHYATQALYGNLLAAGIRIFEYQRSFLHAKVAVIDHHWATVGSSNIDPFSLLLAREANVVVLDRRFAEDLEQSLAAAMRDGARACRPIAGSASRGTRACCGEPATACCGSSSASVVMAASGDRRWRCAEPVRG
jgi:cardiolipin synthase